MIKIRTMPEAKNRTVRISRITLEFSLSATSREGEIIDNRKDDQRHKKPFNSARGALLNFLVASVCLVFLTAYILLCFAAELRTVTERPRNLQLILC
jgi:hypothetical protein